MMTLAFVAGYGWLDCTHDARGYGLTSVAYLAMVSTIQQLRATTHKLLILLRCQCKE